MALTNAGRDLIAKMIHGSAVASDEFDATYAHIGVGDSAAGFAATQTDLQAVTNKFRRPMEATFPTLATNAINFKSSFGTDEANFAWAEWGVFNHVSAGTMLNRKVEALGTKTGGTWVLTVTLTVNAS